MIMPKFHLKRLSNDRRETSSEEAARAQSGDDRGKEKKPTDFHQNRLSNQMGTVPELGQRRWGESLNGQISTQTRHEHQNKVDFSSILLLCCHVILNALK